MEFTQILTIAGKEFRDRMRNRWVLAVALVFTVFSLAIAYFGGAQQGTVGFRSIEFTIASLVSLVLLCHKCGIMNPPNSFCEGR